MTTAKHNRVHFESVATFATTAPSSLSTMTHLPAIDAKPPKAVQLFDDAQETAADGLQSRRYPTIKSAAWDLMVRIYTGSKMLASSGSDATACFCQALLENYFGAVANTSAGFTVAAGSTSTIVNLADASTVAVGEALMFGGTSTDGEVAFVISKSGNALTLDHALSTAANYTTGAEVYCAFNFVPTVGAYAPKIYANWEGGSHSRLLGPGDVTGFKMTGLAAGDGCRYNFTLDGNTYADGITSGTHTENAFTGTPLVAVGSPWYINGTAVAVADLEVDFGVKKEVIDATSGTNARSGMEITEIAPSGSFTEFYNSTRWTQYQAGTPVALMFVCQVPAAGHAAKAKGSIAIYVPDAELTVEDVGHKGQRATKVTWVGKRTTAAEITAGFSAPIRFAVFGGE